MSTLPSDGQCLVRRPQITTQPISVASNILYNMICNASAADTSPWVSIESFSKFALEISGTASGISVQINGSLSSDNPSLSNTAGFPIGSALTSTGITFPALAGVRWVQIVAATVTGGTVNVNLSGTSP